MTNHHAASSTDCPTVNRPWFWWIAALLGPSPPASAASCLLVEHDGASAFGHDDVILEDRKRPA